MSQLALITLLGGGADLPGFGGGVPTHPRPTPPIVLPPVPPGTPDNSLPTPPAGGEVPSHPIFIPGTPEHPITLPPGQVWPPLNPSDGVGEPVLLLVWVVGTDKYRWVSIGPPTVWPPTQAQPKR